MRLICEKTYVEIYSVGVQEEGVWCVDWVMQKVPPFGIFLGLKGVLRVKFWRLFLFVC